MSSRRVYDVSPMGDKWAVKARGPKQASLVFDKKEDAVDRAREMAAKLPLAQVVVRKQDGTIQTEYTYGEDPYPPAG